MLKEFKIECDWFGRETESPMDRWFSAEIGLGVGEDWLTRLEEIDARTVRTHLRGCGYQLAQWFAGNWWRLRWEPESRSSRKDPNWRMAHSLTSAGGGYVWPNLLFASDGETLAVGSVASRQNAAFEPIRYLNHILSRISAEEFEEKVDVFIEGVLSRMHTLKIRDDNLSTLWGEVLAERHDPKMARWRRLEAKCGYDPDDAPEETMRMLFEDTGRLGRNALEEVAAQGRHATLEILKAILDLADSTAKPAGHGHRCKMPELSTKPRYPANLRPWQRATTLAKIARDQWGLGKKPITNKQLADLLGTKPGIFTSRQKPLAPLSLAVRSRKTGDFDFYLDSSWSTTRRFACGRLLGDHLDLQGNERLIPSTDAKTARQQFQRAFAQEFLCPINALLEKIQTDDPDEDDVAEAAKHFDVSPLMIRTTLVNKGELDREALSWDD